MTQAIKQAIITSKDSLDASSATERLALFDDSGEPYTGFKDVADLVTTATAIGTAAKTTTSDEPTAGTIVPIKFTSGNSANSATVAFNGGTARACKLGGTASTGAKLAIAATGVALFYFDGTDLHQLGEYV